MFALSSTDHRAAVRRSLFMTALALVGLGPSRGQSVPMIFASGIVNAAGAPLPPAPVAPGSIVSIYGSNFAPTASHNGVSASAPLPTLLNGAQVFMNGIAAPLFYVGFSQINAQVPWEVSGAPSLNVQVVSNGSKSEAVTVALADVAPGVFIVTHSLDGSPVTAVKQAKPGESLTIYCTGLGLVTNRPPSGVAATSSPLATTIGNVGIDIGGIGVAPSFSGLTPSFTGLYQVNVQVPSDTAPGGAVPLVIGMRGALSNTVAIAVADSTQDSQPPAITSLSNSSLGQQLT